MPDSGKSRGCFKTSPIIIYKTQKRGTTSYPTRHHSFTLPLLALNATHNQRSSDAKHSSTPSSTLAPSFAKVAGNDFHVGCAGPLHPYLTSSTVLYHFNLINNTLRQMFSHLPSPHLSVGILVKCFEKDYKTSSPRQQHPRW